MLFFRTDANETIGVGHVMRCMSIAEEAKSRGIACTFVVSDEKALPLLNDRGFSAFVTNSDFNRLEKLEESFSELIEQNSTEAVILDTYYATAEYMQEIKAKTRLMYIDDLASFAYPVDILLSYNIYAPRLDYQSLYNNACVAIPKMLIGTQYVPLRKEFRFEKKRRMINSGRTSVLILTGGSDSRHVAISLLKEILNSDLILDSNIRFNFVVGRYNTDFDEMMYLSAESDNINILFDVSQMAKLMRDSDIAISASGSTLYELCACGIPTITYVLADNQINGALEFSNQEIMINVGDVRKDEFDYNEFVVTLRRLIANTDRRSMMISNEEKVVDGWGTVRIIDELLPYTN